MKHPVVARDERALKMMDRAMKHLAHAFDVTWSRDRAQANLDARLIFFGCANSILRRHGIPITREEIEVRTVKA